MLEERGLQRICVFCGSRRGGDAAYANAARALGKAVAIRGLTLVYGGANVGLMGVLADAALAEGGTVIGVIPRGLASKEIAHEGLAELIHTDTMHERKERMISLSDAFVSMPGGWGTFDELFEVLTLAQLGFHDKPSGFLNVNGYFDPLLALLEHTRREEFVAEEHANLYVSSDEPEALLDKVFAFRPRPLGDKWPDRRVRGTSDVTRRSGSEGDR